MFGSFTILRILFSLKSFLIPLSIATVGVTGWLGVQSWINSKIDREVAHQQIQSIRAQEESIRKALEQDHQSEVDQLRTELATTKQLLNKRTDEVIWARDHVAKQDELINELRNDPKIDECFDLDISSEFLQ